jgi:hypothetical protein
MNNAMKALAVASAVIAKLAVAPALYALGSESSVEPMMGLGMMA